MSERDSKAWSESEGRPCGSSNSIQSPGHKVVEVAGAWRSTARCAACCVERSSEEPYAKEEPSARVIRRLAG